MKRRADHSAGLMLSLARASVRGDADDSQGKFMNLTGLRTVAAVAGLLAALATSPGRSLAQTSPQSWPQRPVKFIVPFGPGAGADIGARLLAERLPARWGKPLVIENRPGGDGLVAIQAFLSANDDHTLLFSPSGNFTVQDRKSVV